MTAHAELLLFPCNGNALEAVDCVGERWCCIGFVDDSPSRQGSRVRDLPVFDRSALQRWSTARVLAVPGGPESYRERMSIIASLGLPRTRYASVVHPTAWVSSAASIGYNTLIMAGVVLTSNAVVGNHCCVLPNTVVHHDVRIGDGTLVGANVTIAGGVAIGEHCYVGASSGVMNGVRVGDGALIGFGANVVRDVACGARVVGNPARSL